MQLSKRTLSLGFAAAAVIGTLALLQSYRPRPAQAGPAARSPKRAATRKPVPRLRVIATPGQAHVAAGRDILVRLHLEAATPLRVWDSKYSHGYRSWWFRVKTPDGKVHLLRRAIVRKWSKNAPHPVSIAPKKPYILTGWGAQHGDELHGQYYFSLQKLGLSTQLKGRYEITGMFEQGAPPFPLQRWRHYSGTFWRGKIQSNTVVVTVR